VVSKENEPTPELVEAGQEFAYQLYWTQGFRRPGSEAFAVRDIKHLRDAIILWVAEREAALRAHAAEAVSGLVARLQEAEKGEDDLRRERDIFEAAVDAAEQRIGTLLNMNHEIAASNADHIRWHREAEAALREKQGQIEALEKKLAFWNSDSYRAGVEAQIERERDLDRPEYRGAAMEAIRVTEEKLREKEQEIERLDAARVRLEAEIVERGKTILLHFDRAEAAEKRASAGEALAGALKELIHETEACDNPAYEGVSSDAGVMIQARAALKAWEEEEKK